MLALILAAAEHEPNDIILPHDINEVIWGSIAFLIIFGALWKFGLGPARQGMATRRERIEAELSEAADARSTQEARLSTLRAQLSGADSERERILTDARATAAGIATDSEERSAREAEEARERSRRDIAASQQQAMADLQRSVSDLTLGAAEVVVRNTLDDSAQDELIESYIAQMANN